MEQVSLKPIQIQPQLTRYAAIGLALVMILAIFFHLTRGWPILTRG